MTIYLASVLACAPDSIEVAPEYAVGIELDNGTSVSEELRLEYREAFIEGAEGACPASVEIAAFNGESIDLGELAFPTLEIGSGARSRPGNDPDSFTDDGQLKVVSSGEGDLDEVWIGLVTVSSLTDDLVEFALTEGNSCRRVDAEDICEAASGTLSIAGPRDTIPNDGSRTIGPGEWMEPESEVPYCGSGESST